MGIHMVFFFFKLTIFAFGTCHEISYNFFFLFSDRQRRIYIYILTAPIKKCGHSTQEGDKLQLLWLILSMVTWLTQNSDLAKAFCYLLHQKFLFAGLDVKMLLLKCCCHML